MYIHVRMWQYVVHVLITFVCTRIMQVSKDSQCRLHVNCKCSSLPTLVRVVRERLGQQQVTKIGKVVHTCLTKLCYDLTRSLQAACSVQWLVMALFTRSLVGQPCERGLASQTRYMQLKHQVDCHRSVFSFRATDTLSRIKKKIVRKVPHVVVWLKKLDLLFPALQCCTLKSKLFSVQHCKAGNDAWG